MGRRAELWLFLLQALAAAPASCSAHALGAAAAAAAHDSAALPHAYPHILHAYGMYTLLLFVGKSLYPDCYRRCEIFVFR